MQFTLKGNAFEQPFSFDIKHISSQLINNLLWRFMTHFQHPALFWNRMLTFEWFLKPTSSKCCLKASNWISPNWIYSFFADIRSIDCDTLCLFLFRLCKKSTDFQEFVILLPFFCVELENVKRCGDGYTLVNVRGPGL